MVTDEMDGISNGKQRWNVVAVQDLQAKLEDFTIHSTCVGHEFDEQVIIEKLFKPFLLLAYCHVRFWVCVLLDAGKDESSIQRTEYRASFLIEGSLLVDEIAQFLDAPLVHVEIVRDEFVGEVAFQALGIMVGSR